MKRLYRKSVLNQCLLVTNRLESAPLKSRFSCFSLPPPACLEMLDSSPTIEYPFWGEFSTLDDVSFIKISSGFVLSVLYVSLN